MAGYSYYCEIPNLGQLIADMKRACEGVRATFLYDERAIAELNRREWARIKWFYYCDQHDGNTIRLYDRQFFQEVQGLYREPRTCVILRGKNLGKASGDVKTAIRRFLGTLNEPPSGVNTKPENMENCMQFFGRLNKGNSGTRYSIRARNK